MGIQSQGESREKLIKQDIMNGKQSNLHQINKSQPTFGLNKGLEYYSNKEVVRIHPKSNLDAF